MNRRAFVTGLGAMLAAPLGAEAQHSGRLPTIGLLGSGTAAAQREWTAAFLKRLRDLGWTEGRNVAIEYRWAEGRTERFAEIAAEFVRLNVNVIPTHNTPPALAAKKATSVIPIVFATAGDPVGSGIVASLARPGGNVTGISSQAPDTVLMSYGPNWPHMWSRAADIIDRILRGTKPAEIPVEQPTKFDFVINVTTAKALGLTIPPSLLARADQVIE